MAIVTIQHRRGEYADYDPSKVLPGELVVTQTGDPNTTDGEAAYIATKAGSVKRIPFATEVEDLKAEMDDVVEDAREAIASAIDPTLMQSGKAADAKKTGDEIADLKSEIDSFEGISDEVKEALLACFAHVAWIGTDGQSYYDALETALTGEDEYWLWKYSPADGLLSNQSYMTFDTNATGWSESIVNNALRLHVPQRTDGGGASWRIAYRFNTSNSGTLKGRIKTNGLATGYNPTIMGSRLQISNGTAGVRCAFNAYFIDDIRYLEIAYVEGSETKSVLTTLLADVYYDVELSLNGSNQKIIIDGNVIVDSNTLATTAKESHVAVQATRDAESPDGVYLGIKWLWFKENGGD